MCGPGGVRWGPPVQSVEVIDEPEGVGIRRRVHARFGKRSGQFVERRRALASLKAYAEHGTLRPEP